MKFLGLSIFLTGALVVFGAGANDVTEEQAVIVHFAYGTTDLNPLFELEAQIEKILAETSAGELDGNEVAIDGIDAYLYLYGPNADVLLETIRPTLLAAPFMKNASAKKVYGELGSEVRRVEVQLAP